MTNTVFAPGDRDPQEIMGEVEDGYYVSGHRIPSVSEARENFRITAVKVYEIKNGQLGQLYRDGGITSDSRDYFMSIDAVGSDFRMYPIPNCGKGPAHAGQAHEQWRPDHEGRRPPDWA